MLFSYTTQVEGKPLVLVALFFDLLYLLFLHKGYIFVSNCLIDVFDIEYNCIYRPICEIW